MVDENKLQWVEEDMHGGYSNFGSYYEINRCLGLEINIRDKERTLDLINEIMKKLKGLNMDSDIEYEKKYMAALDKDYEEYHNQMKKARAKSEGVE